MKNTWRFTGKELDYLKEVIDSGYASSTVGSMNQRFERAFAEKVGCEFAITFNSGTSTLHAALHAFDVHAGDEVIIPPITVISNFDVVVAQNAIPVFADVDPDTFNIDPEDIKRKITSRTKCIMPVSIYGVSCDLDPIMEIGREYSIPVLNDAAEAFGCVYKNKQMGPIADVTSYSTENSKHITTGDGGIIVTNNADFAMSMRKYGSLGYASMKSTEGRVRIMNKDSFQDPNYKRHDELGLNYRMPEVAAALGLAQTERLNYFLDLRISIANLYKEAIKNCDYLIPQAIPEGSNNTYWTFAVKYERTDVTWYEFRKKFIDFGGDGIYACWALSYEETVVSSGAYKKHCPQIYQNIDYPRGICPVAEEIQPKIMQFVTNYGSVSEASQYVEALIKTINYFD
tara:strand:+ start:21874 stop:23073 length:1200 start_codon:yes stop_codon:yes gene_type:complete